MPAPYHTPRAARLASELEREEIEDLLGTYSDLYKDVFGVRPRSLFGPLRTAGAAAISEEIDALVEYAEGEEPTEGEGWKLN